MSSNSAEEHVFHKRKDIDLRDAWEDAPAVSIPKLKPFQKDLTYDQARGNTWGYQSTGFQSSGTQSSARSRKRLDKFLYTGALDTVPLNQFHDTTGSLSRIGVGLKTEVDAWEISRTELAFKRVDKATEKLVEKSFKMYRPLDFFSDDDERFSQRLTRLERSYREQNQLSRVKHSCWVSDHFGIALGIRVV
jgi:tyrosyl-DNA phosphodiesterase 2